MSLRTDIHTAFDVITPATGGMAERLVDTARRQAPAHRRRRFMVRMRAPLALIAALVGVAIVVTVLVGARLMHTATPVPVPAAPDANQAAFSAMVSQLEARPITLPKANSPADCPNTANTSGTFDYGAGPAYGNGGQETKTAWGYFWDVTYFIPTATDGPVLIRGRDLITGSPVVFTGKYASGPMTSGNGLPSGWHTEVVLDPRHPQSHNQAFGVYPVRQSLPKTFIGCFGVQMDSAGFTEQITGLAEP